MFGKWIYFCIENDLKFDPKNLVWIGQATPGDAPEAAGGPSRKLSSEIGSILCPKCLILTLKATQNQAKNQLYTTWSDQYNKSEITLGTNWRELPLAQ